MKKFIKVIITICLVLVLCLSTTVVSYAQAATTKSKVKLNKTNVTLYVGQTLKLKMSGTNQTVIWSSSDKKVASVSKKGNVKATGKGNAIITAKVGSKKYTCKVNVKKITSKTVFSDGSMLTSINTLQFSTKEIRKYSDGSYEVDAYIYNGYNNPMSNINVTGMTLFDKNGIQIASASFGVCSNLVLFENTYAVWTFRFDKEYVSKGDFDFSRIYLNVAWEN